MATKKFKAIKSTRQNRRQHRAQKTHFWPRKNPKVLNQRAKTVLRKLISGHEKNQSLISLNFGTHRIHKKSTAQYSYALYLHLLLNYASSKCNVFCASKSNRAYSTRKARSLSLTWYPLFFLFSFLFSAREQIGP